MQLVNNPLTTAYDNLAANQAIPQDVTNDFFNQVEEPQLASEAVQQWLGGNLGTNGESSFGANYMADQQAQAAAQSGLYGQQYVTNELGNMSNAIGQLEAERNNFFGNDVNLETQQNNTAISEAMALNQMNQTGSLANQSAQLNTNQMNQAGAVDNAQLTQSGLGMINNYNLDAAGQLNNFGLQSAGILGGYNTNLMNNQLQANEATAANETKLLTAPFGLLGGVANSLGGSGGTSGGSGSGGGSLAGGLGSAPVYNVYSPASTSNYTDFGGNIGSSSNFSSFLNNGF